MNDTTECGGNIFTTKNKDGVFMESRTMETDGEGLQPHQADPGCRRLVNPLFPAAELNVRSWKIKILSTFFS